MKTYIYDDTQVFLAYTDDVDATPICVVASIGAYPMDAADKLRAGCECCSPYDDAFAEVTTGDGTESIVPAEVINEENEGGDLLPRWCTEGYAALSDLRVRFSAEQAEYRQHEDCARLLRAIARARGILENDYATVRECISAQEMLARESAEYLSHLREADPNIDEGDCYDTPDDLGVGVVMDALAEKIAKTNDES